jgi:hypothetical protein
MGAMKRAKLNTEHAWTLDGFRAFGGVDAATRACIEQLRKAAEQTLAPIGGRIDHNAPPSFLGPTSVARDGDAGGADLVAFAIQWTVLVPASFDSEAEAVRDAWKWVN